MKRRFLLAVLLLFFCANAGAESLEAVRAQIIDVSPKTTGTGIFADAEINRLIDENYAIVREKGYAELRIPERLHHIPRDVMSPNAIDAAEKLIKAGFQAYIVGGTVRDLILGNKVNDFDITTDAPIETQKKIFSDMSFHEAGVRIFGIVHYPDEDIDLAVFQNIPADYYGKKGIPEFDPSKMTSTHLLNDSFQRDLTMNTLYYDVTTGDIIDFLGGLHSVREEIIDTVTDSELEFTSNPINALRALRFRARYGFHFSDRVDEALKENALRYVERIRPYDVSFTLRKMFSEGYSRRSYEELMNYGLFVRFFPFASDVYMTEEYKNYASKAMSSLDERYKAGEKLPACMFMAEFLRPLLKEIGISALDVILNMEANTYGYEEGEKETLKNILLQDKAGKSENFSNPEKNRLIDENDAPVEEEEAA